MGFFTFSRRGFTDKRSLAVVVALGSGGVFATAPALQAEEESIPTTEAVAETVVDAASAAKEMLGAAGGSAAKMVSNATGVDVASLRQQIEDAREAMQRLQRDQEDLAEQLSGAQQKVEDLETARNEVEGQLAEKERALADTQSILAESKSELATAKQALADAESERDASQREVVGLQGDVARLSGENDKLVATVSELSTSLSDREQRIDSLQQLLPAGEGGSITTDQARKEASEAQQLLMRSAMPAANVDATTAEDARALVRRNQFLVGYAMGARGIYLTKPGDSLSLVSAYFYGEGNKWKDIMQANQHLITNPDRVRAGIPLIIP